MKIGGICPAAACAERIAGIERRLAAAPPFEADYFDLLMTGETERAQLAAIEAASPAGALAQLLAAIREIRVGDEDARARARALEAQVRAFLRKDGMLDAADAARLSQTRLGGHVAAGRVPAPAISEGRCGAPA